MLSLNGSPAGASVYIDGNQRGRLSTHTRLGLRVGDYELKATARGYETYAQRIRIRQDRETELMIQLIPKSRMKAGVRSLMFPGWGQFYSGRKTSGSLLLLAAVSAGAAAGYAHMEYLQLEDEYVEAVNAYNTATKDFARYQQEMDDVSDRRSQMSNIRQIALYALGAMWAYNVFDAVVFMPRLRDEGDTTGPMWSVRTVESGPVFVATMRF